MRARIFGGSRWCSGTARRAEIRDANDPRRVGTARAPYSPYVLWDDLYGLVPRVWPRENVKTLRRRTVRIERIENRWSFAFYTWSKSTVKKKEKKESVSRVQGSLNPFRPMSYIMKFKVSSERCLCLVRFVIYVHETRTRMLFEANRFKTT